MFQWSIFQHESLHSDELLMTFKDNSQGIFNKLSTSETANQSFTTGSSVAKPQIRNKNIFRFCKLKILKELDTFQRAHLKEGCGIMRPFTIMGEFGSEYQSSFIHCAC
ncbi:CLUMA_CG006837, isoform A [Clunio marinus]|uniref:CLUMA_CG006837, isoform A n=1 Tax=Clunio marinus TaxID=568069 RepID=A0A1J1I368_9DIPT|nr:CLUMA_CG006837, isoform A [Clunio marinus]